MPQCPDCREILNADELSGHVCSTDLTCHFCGKEFVTPNGKDDHSHRKHGTEREFPPVFIGRGRRRTGRSRNQIPYDAMGNLSLHDEYPSDSILKKNRGLNVDEYIADHLQPNEEFHKPYNKDIDALATTLKKELPFSVREVVKGGSLGKGTGVIDSADADLVVFLNNFKDQNQFQSDLPTVLRKLQSCLESTKYGRGGKIRGITQTPHAVQFQFRSESNGEWRDVDLLPAFDIVDKIGKVAVYNKIRDASRPDREFYSAELTKLQIEHVKEMPPKVKDLIRLIKNWKSTDLKALGVAKPASYAMELVTINAWKAGGSKEDFDMRKGFFQVLKQLSNSDVNLEIIDPANPYNNVASRYRDWPKLGEAAKMAMEQPLFSDIRQSDNSWR